VLVIPPFAEEMNKSRRMLSQQGRRLAEAGFTVLLPDLYGTGDSEGDFSAATWVEWIEDLKCCIHWFSEKNIMNVSLLSMRSGALLVAQLPEEILARIDCFSLWQPVINGDIFLSQFLRLKLAADMSKASVDKLTVKEIKASLVKGQSVEVAGHMLSPKLANGLEGAKFINCLDCIRTRVFWFEIVSDENRSIPIQNQKMIDLMKEKGINVSVTKVTGPPFWMATEIVDVPSLLDSTVDVLVGATQ